ncbi:MAG: aldehyde dehydrogenase [Mogibacterium sp.]|nr:aldehyde dehydrogenase [Mogibacterium sp.]
MDHSKVYEKQHGYFMTGATRSDGSRIEALNKLRGAIRKWEVRIDQAMMNDLHKHPSEVYMCELALVLEEIRYHKKHLKKWMSDQRAATPLTQFKGNSFTTAEPYGSVLIASPWNYPVQLCLSPLVGAISAGNTAVIKPSAQTPETSRLLSEMIAETFDPSYVTVAECSRDSADALFDQPWDLIFFTGNASAAKKICATAAKYLTPVVTELGGKSPVIVDKTANIPTAAKRIAFGKVLNAGQTCVAPDYCFIHRSVLDEFVGEYEKALKAFFPKGDHDQMVHIVSKRHYDRVKSLITDAGTVALGGGFDDSTLFIEPTLLTGITTEDRIMNEEIFGPIFPLVTFDDLDTVIDHITSRPKPLALYLFTEDRKVERKVLNTCSFGGGCINDVIMHLATTSMPFGGIGNSGNGAYHGRQSFDTFSHRRSIMRKATWIDLPIRYMPYSRLTEKIVKVAMH